MQAVADGRSLPLGAPKQRALLVVLLLHPNEVVDRDRLVDLLWGSDPPRSAVQSLQVHVHGLRQPLGRDRIETHGTGYQFRLEPGELDFDRFERLVDRAAESLAAKRAADAAEDLRSALALWVGSPLADLGGEPVAEAEAPRLDDRRLRALELVNEAELSLGRHRELVPALERLIEEEPYREPFRAQHVLALYRAGRQKDALDAYRAARDALVEELGVNPGPDLQQLERRILRHDPSLAAPEPPQRGRVELPLPPTPLVGRRLEVAAVASLLRRDDVRLVTLTGPGGTGKTRLALAVADELAPEVRDGVLFVDLSPVRDPTLLASTVANALGVQEGEEPLSRAVAQHLQGRSMLLLLDNLEQLLPGTPFISEMLTVSPRLLVLATSRAPLRLSGEHEYPVPPLPIPEANRASSFEELTTNDAVRLFVARAQAVDPGFELTDERARTVAEICRRLDGLPLAIELAAARSKLLSPETIARRLEQALEFLTGGARDLPARQQTLRATLDWSHELLAEPERTLFARLAVFVGGCTIDAAADVCADGDIDLLTTIASLVDESLLRRVGEGRYAMLETIREYALEQLELVGEAEELRRRHAQHFVKVAEGAEHELTAAAETGVRERLEREHDNFRAALSWSHRAGAADLELVLAAALARFWLIRGHLLEGRSWLENALGRDSRKLPAVRAKALRGIGVLALKHRDYEEAEQFLDESLTLSRELGDTTSMIRSMLSLGVVAVAQSDYERAQRLNEETLALAREAEDRRVVATAINNLGDLALHEGDYETAARLARESLALARELGHREGAALALVNLAQAYLYLDRLAEAVPLLEEALLLGRELGYQEAIVYALEGLAAIAVGRGDPAAAARLLGAGEALLETIGASLDRAGRDRHERTLEALRDQLPPQQLSRHWQDGRLLTLEQFTAEAMRVG